MKNLFVLFIATIAVISCNKNKTAALTHNCDNITSIDQLPWAKDLAEGKTDCKIYPYASITKYRYNDTTVFLFKNPGNVGYNSKCSGTYFNCEGKQINYTSYTQGFQEFLAILKNKQLLWEAKSSSPNNCDDITSIDQLPWAKELIESKAGAGAAGCELYKGAFFSKYNYKGKTVFEFRNPASSTGEGVCKWAIYDCAGNVILHLFMFTGGLKEIRDFFDNRQNEKILWVKN